MRWASALSQRVQAEDALVEVLAALEEQLTTAPTVLLLFATVHHLPAMHHLARMVRDRYPMAHLLGGIGPGVIGAQREVERREALSLTAAVLPNVNVEPLRFAPHDRPDGPWLASVEASSRQGTLLVLAEPSSVDVSIPLAALARRCPSATQLGGLSARSEVSGTSVLLLDDGVFADGLVGLWLTGDLRVDPVVAQAARPVGEPMIVTRVQDRIVQELNVGRPTDALQRLYRDLSPRDQQLCNTALLLGVERPEHRGREHQSGDFLLGDVLGMDPRGGAMAVGRDIERYQVVQFHLCDPEVAERQLRAQLLTLPESQRLQVRGGVVFSGVGRGERLYGEPDRDIQLLTRHVGPVPLGGLVCNGEIGPVEAGSHVHHYATVMALMRAGSDDEVAA